MGPAKRLRHPSCVEMNSRYNYRREDVQIVRPVVIIGIGNPLGQDAGLGPAVVARLSARIDDPRVEFLVPTTLTFELAATIWKARRVIFIDVCAALAPGEIERRNIECDPHVESSLDRPLSPEALLVLTGRLYGCVPMAEIWLMGEQRQDLSEELTPAAANQLDELVRAIQLRIHLELTDDAPIDAGK